MVVVEWRLKRSLAGRKAFCGVGMVGDSRQERVASEWSQRQTARCCTLLADGRLCAQKLHRFTAQRRFATAEAPSACHLQFVSLRRASKSKKKYVSRVLVPLLPYTSSSSSSSPVLPRLHPIVLRRNLPHPANRSSLPTIIGIRIHGSPASPPHRPYPQTLA